MTDPIADLLIRIKNAQAVFHETVSVPFSTMKFKIAKILEREGFVELVEIRRKRSKAKKIIKIILKYEEKGLGQEKIPAISGVERISKPGRRIYAGPKEIKKYGKGRGGIIIVSTPKGIMTDREARKQNTGGEVICQVW